MPLLPTRASLLSLFAFAFALLGESSPRALAAEPASTAMPSSTTVPSSTADEAPWDDHRRTWGLSLGGGLVPLARDRPIGIDAVSAGWLHATYSPLVLGSGRHFRFDVRLGALLGGFPQGYGGLFGADVQLCMELRVTRGHGIEYCPLGFAYYVQAKGASTTGIGMSGSVGWRWHPERAFFRTLRASMVLAFGGALTGPPEPPNTTSSTVDPIPVAMLGFEVGFEF